MPDQTLTLQDIQRRLGIGTAQAMRVKQALDAHEGWRPIATYNETDLMPPPIVLRPHRIHGPMDVRRLTDAEREAWTAADASAISRDIDWRWVNGDMTTMWTETAFLPYWMPLPAPPREEPDRG